MKIAANVCFGTELSDAAVRIDVRFHFLSDAVAPVCLAPFGQNAQWQIYVAFVMRLTAIKTPLEAKCYRRTLVKHLSKPTRCKGDPIWLELAVLPGMRSS